MKAPMKKLLAGLSVAALTLMSANLIAHPGKNGKQAGKRGQMMEKVYTQAGVSDEQKAQIKAIHESYKPQLQSLRESGKSLREQKKTLDPVSANYVANVQALFDQGHANKRQAVTLRAQMKNEIANILTAEQRAEIQALKEAKKEKRKERRQNRREKYKKYGQSQEQS